MLFLDTEFNAHGGQLISLALVSDRHEHEFYAVLPLPSDVHPWVAQHVVPILDRDPEPEPVVRLRLKTYLLRHCDDVVADWPEDFKHLLDLITMPGGMRVNVDFSMHLVSGIDAKPDVPHNALSDARALREAWKAARQCW